jgi:hypothetical protein
MRRPRAHTLLTAFGFVLCAGCYSYSPVQSPRPGMEVRARLNTEAAVRRSQGLEEPVVRLEGIVVESSPEAISLDVLVARSSSAFQNVVIRDTVQLQTSEIQSLLSRRISVPRTALFTAGGIAATFLLVKGIDQITGGTGESPPGGNPTLRIPLQLRR